MAKTDNRAECPGYSYRTRRTGARGAVYGCEFKASPERNDGLCKVCGKIKDRAERNKQLAADARVVREEATALGEKLSELLRVQFEKPSYWGKPTTINLPLEAARELLGNLQSPQWVMQTLFDQREFDYLDTQ